MHLRTLSIPLAGALLALTTGCSFFMGPPPPTEPAKAEPAKTEPAKTDRRAQKPDLVALIGDDVDTANVKRLVELRPGMSRAEVDAVLPGAAASKDAFAAIPLAEDGIENVTIYFREQKAVSAKIIFSSAVSTPELWEELKKVASAKYGPIKPEDAASDHIYWPGIHASISQAKKFDAHHSLEFEIDAHRGNPAPRDLDALIGPDKGKPPKLFAELKKGMTPEELGKTYPGVLDPEVAKFAFREIPVNDLPGVRALKFYFPTKEGTLAQASIVFRKSASRPADFDAAYDYLVKKLGAQKKSDHVYWRNPKVVLRDQADFDELEYELR